MKPIRGFTGIYSATPEGHIYAHPRDGKGGHRGKLLKPWLIGRGYYTVSLYTEPKKQHKFLVHRLIAEAFIPNPKKLREVNHKNGNRLDNRPHNLEWCTSKRNKQHAWKHGLYTHRGTNHYLAKLTPKDVKVIRNTPKERGYIAELSRRFQVSEGSIRDVIYFRSWKHTS